MNSTIDAQVDGDVETLDSFHLDKTLGLVRFPPTRWDGKTN
jgi:hypothetical protein